MDETKKAYDLLRQLQEELLELDEVPLLGLASPQFPVDELQIALRDHFKAKAVEIHVTESKWRSIEELSFGIGEQPVITSLTYAPIEGRVCWVMSSHDSSLLAKLLMFRDLEELSLHELHDEHLRLGLSRYCMLEVLHILENCSFVETLAPRISEDGSLPESSSFCYDVSFSVNGTTVLGRLMIPQEFQRSWKRYFTPKKPTTLPAGIAEKVDVVLGIEVGRIKLSFTQWSQVKKGDCLILDTYSFDPERENNTVLLSYNGTPYFRGSIVERGVEIVDSPVFVETASQESSEMAEQQPAPTSSDENHFEPWHDDEEI